MNKIILIGRLTKEPELRYTQSDKMVLKNTLAVNRKFRDETGETTADFIDVVFWGKRAELISKYVEKGHRIGVVGELQSRTYQANDGSNRTVYEVIVDELSFLETKKAEPVSASTVNPKKEEKQKDFEVGDEIDLGNLGSDTPF